MGATSSFAGAKGTGREDDGHMPTGIIVLSSHLLNKCLLPSQFLLPEIPEMFCYLPLPFVLAVPLLCPSILPLKHMFQAGVSMSQLGLSISVIFKVAYGSRPNILMSRKQGL